MSATINVTVINPQNPDIKTHENKLTSEYITRLNVKEENTDIPIQINIL
jgi:hypothetical protein